MFLLYFYVPATHLEIVKNAIFAVGAGTIGNYTHCSWEIKGEGQFMPKEGSNAFIGTVNTIEKVMEYKVEMVCSEEVVRKAIHALKESHPYETPAYQIIRCEQI
ncbi:structural toxin protein (hemagglutinin/hemolysin) RtxA (plasmid) [Legionella adelaidensis]|uniref:Structural toxin protein (Hemagglutinin/hemolysin) RtxA n=1 Tax=Legionella adelaidensis TaxID=45056 RepID=A0A0W0R1K7_9GAMM|nr:hypothetical protein [Legionella adelaidensis]KTC64951.1 structural toxin protein (hemagglutinin/hemolysin) RtxA [Legionella adelaidensis]VEH85634.1 structural toxin protein (hemagglutinin/hemolysin) RtxA [Legionella adelaidensis]